MLGLDGRLTVTLLVAMLGLQAVCWLLAKGLGLRLERSAVVCGWLAPLIVLGPVAGRPPAPRSHRRAAGASPAPRRSPRAPSHQLLNDTLYQLLPWELEVRHALAGRRLPFWSDTLEGGSSPWANPQAGVLSPLADGGAGLSHPAPAAGGALPQAPRGLRGDLAARPPDRPQPRRVAAGRGRLLSRRRPLLLGAVSDHRHGRLGALAGGRRDPALPPPGTAGDRHHGGDHRRAPALGAPGDRGLRRPVRRGLRPRPAAAGGPLPPRLRRRGPRRRSWASASPRRSSCRSSPSCRIRNAPGETLAQTVRPAPVQALSPPSWFEPGYAALRPRALSPHAFGRPLPGSVQRPLQLGGLGGRLHRPGGVRGRA